MISQTTNQLGQLMDIRNFDDVIGLEKVIIAAAIKNEGHRDDILHKLEKEDFYHTGLGNIFKICQNFYITGTAIDEHIVSSKLGKRNKALLESCLKLTYNELGVDHILSEIKDQSKIRNIHGFADKIKRMAINPDNNSSNILGQMHNGLVDLLSDHSENGVVTPGDIIEDYIKELEKDPSESNFVLSHLKNLDEIVVMDEGMLILIAARPSFGKTQLALQICLENALRGNHTLFMSLEMPRKDIMNRLVSNAAEVDFFKIRKKCLSGTELEKIREFYPKLAKLPFHFECTGSANVAEVKAKARRISLKTKGKLNLIVVDYLQMMNMEKTENNRNIELGKIAEGMKRLAMDLGIPVICLSQLSRAVDSREDKRPMLSDLRDSGVLEQVADCVLFLYKESYYTKRKEDENKLELIVAKQRNGPIGVVEIENITKYQKMKDKIEEEIF